MAQKKHKASEKPRGKKVTRLADGRFMGVKITTREDMRRDSYAGRDARSAAAG